MANSYVEYTGTGTNGPFNVTFAYLSKSHVRVWNGVTEDTTFTWLSDTQIQTTSVVPSGTVVHIGRFSSQDTKLVDYQDAQQLTEATLDLDADQSFFLGQEAIDITDRTMTKPFGADYFDATSKNIKNIADGVDNNDAVNKAQVDALTAADVLLASQWATLLDALVASTDYSAKEYAIGTTVPAGSAKEWASEPSALVDGVSYSAKKYAGDAATSASAASASASAASADAASAAASYDSFDDRYLGTKTSDPTLDNDGNALLDGALYFNTTANKMKVYDLGSTTWLTINTEPGPSAKGKLLVDQSASVRAQLAVGTNGQILTADSAQSLGMKWADPAASGGLTAVQRASIWWGHPIGVWASTVNDQPNDVVWVPSSSNFRGGFYMVAEGSSSNYGGLRTSGPGSGWFQWLSMTGNDSTPRGIAHDAVNDVVVTCGTTDATDGEIWAMTGDAGGGHKATPKAFNLFSIAWDSVGTDKAMVAVGAADGSDAYIVRSKWGGSVFYNTWTEISNPKNANLERIAFSPTLGTVGRFCAVGAPDGSDSYVITSDDGGQTWTERAPGVNVTLRDVQWDSFNNQFLASGDSSTILTSPDGINWTQRTWGSGGTSEFVRGIAAGPGIIIACADQGSWEDNNFTYSTDAGVNWNRLKNGPKLQFGSVINRIKYINGHFVVSGLPGNNGVAGLAWSPSFLDLE